MITDKIKMRSNTVSICVCTYNRNSLLLKLLKALDESSLPSQVAEIMIVDNSASGCAKMVCEAFSKEREGNVGTKLSYYNEKRPGVGHARNVAIKMSAGSLIAFIDDDELPDQNWISNMLGFYSRSEAYAVLGPVIPLFEEKLVYRKFTSSNLFARRRLRTGDSVGLEDWRTGNILIEKQVLLDVGGFPEKFAKSGGEDTALFYMLDAKLGEIQWCDEAVVFEVIDSSRLSYKWFFLRSVRSSASNWRMRRYYSRPEFGWLKILFGFAAPIYFIAFLACLPFSTTKATKFLISFGSGIGRLLSVSGYKSSFYGRG